MPLSATLEAWLYGTHLERVRGAPLNPGNRVAGIPRERITTDIRLDVRQDFGGVDVFIAPRLLHEAVSTGDGEYASAGELQLSQGFLRKKSGPDTFLVGRERLTWGPANFRSPSNPYYFDSGRTNPLASTPGIDLVRYTHGVGDYRLTAGYIRATREVDASGPSRASTLVKIDHQGDAHLLSLIVMQPLEAGGTNNKAAFVGAFGQYLPSDAWLLYWEFGSGRQAFELQPRDGVWAVKRPGSRQQTYLLGAGYTQESGNIVYVEYLRNDGGFNSTQRHGYFHEADRANALLGRNPAAGYMQMGALLSYPPRLLGRNYLWLGCQSNPQDTQLSWRVELTDNLDDDSGQVMLYGEKTLIERVSGFVGITRNFGSERSEFGALIRSQLTVGIKWFGF